MGSVVHNHLSWIRSFRRCNVSLEVVAGGAAQTGRWNPVRAWLLAAIAVFALGAAACSPKPAPEPAATDGAGSQDTTANVLPSTDTGQTSLSCTPTPTATWHAHAGTAPFIAVARQPAGFLVALESQGWRRFKEADGAAAGTWSAAANVFVEAVAVAGSGAFVVAGYAGANPWSDTAHPWAAIFAADGKLAWSEVGAGVGAWHAATGSADGFVLAGHAEPYVSRQAVVHRLSVKGELIWARALPPADLDASAPIALAETATSAVLVGGTRTMKSPSFQEQAVLIAIDATGSADSGELLLPSLSGIAQLGPLLPDGRRALVVDLTSPIDFVRTHLYAWSPGHLDDLGIDTMTYQGPTMSAPRQTTRALTLLPKRLAWLQDHWFSGGYHPNCDVAKGEWVTVPLGAAGPVAAAWLTAAPTCQSAQKECTAEVNGTAMVAMPDGGFAIAGHAGNCGLAVGQPVGTVGWVARYPPRCGP